MAAPSFTRPPFPRVPFEKDLLVAFLGDLQDFELFERQMLFDDLPDVVVEVVGRGNEKKTSS